MPSKLPAIRFLLECQDYMKSNPMEMVSLSKYVENAHEAGIYFLRYGFFESDGSGLSELAKQFTSGNLEGDTPVDLLVSILQQSQDCHGSWLLLQKAYPTPQISLYQFEATDEKDSSFKYGVFLHEIGILEERPSDAFRVPPHYFYNVPFSSLGKKVIGQVSGINYKPQTGASSIPTNAPPTILVDAKGSNGLQIHMGRGDNLQDSTKNQDVGEVKHE